MEITTKKLWSLLTLTALLILVISIGLWSKLQRLEAENLELRNKLKLADERCTDLALRIKGKSASDGHESSLESRPQNPIQKSNSEPPLANDSEIQERIHRHQQNFGLIKYSSLVEEMGGLTSQEFNEFLQALRLVPYEAAHEQLKKVLGEARYKVYQDYLRKIPDRKVLNELRNQLAYTKAPIDTKQDKQLMQIFAEERERVESELGDDPNRMIAYDEFNKIPEGALNQKLQTKQKFYQNIIDRSSSFLTPEQANAISNYFEEKMDVEDMNLLTARKLKELQSPPNNE